MGMQLDHMAYKQEACHSHRETIRHDTSRWDTVSPYHEDTILPRMFPGDTAVIRAENKNMFAEDVKNRCQKIYTDMHTMYAGYVAVITKKMSRIIQAGSCRNCHRHRIVCKGGMRNNCWHKSQHIKACVLHRVNMTDVERTALQQITAANWNAARCSNPPTYKNVTNKNEAANRAISASLTMPAWRYSSPDKWRKKQASKICQQWSLCWKGWDNGGHNKPMVSTLTHCLHWDS